ncbi:MAG: PRC-barrel domain-containing protein [Anaerolineales bacterium]|nr:PRC-barrel domain-containing protein [Anaerolineales bacterium]
MKLKKNARVVTAGGQAVGEVDRVVMNPRTKEVSHLVVRKGLLFPDDRVVPIDLIARSTDGQVILREDAGDLERLPVFEETHYVPLDDYERSQMPGGHYVPPMYWYPPHPVVGWGLAGGDYYGPPNVIRTEENIPTGTVALAEGAKVISADGQHVGNVEQVLTDPQANRATHFVVSSGLLLKTRKLVPTAWISDLGRDEVHLAVGAHLLGELREYQPQAQ